jgi:hypothetical protein
MAKAPKTFTIQGTINPGSSAEGLSISAISSKGKTLDSEIINGSNAFELSFKTKKALRKARKGNINLVVDDLNGDAANLIFEDASGDLSPDSQTSSVVIKAKRGSASVNLDLETTTVGELPPINFNGSRIALTADRDIYTSTQGGQDINGFVDDGQRLTAQDDEITAAAGRLGQNDRMNDASSTDNDRLLLSTNSANKLGDAIGGVQEITGIETISITADQDNGPSSVFDKVSGLKSLDISGSFTSVVSHTIRGAVEAGARSFDFSGITAQSRGVVMNDFATGSNQETLRIEGSQAIEGDHFKGGLFNAVINGNGGADELIGSELGASSTLNGGSGRDFITLNNNNASDTVKLIGITNELDQDTITGFAGQANNAANYDILQLDAATYSNYDAGSTVNLQTVNDVFANRGARNVILKDTAANLDGFQFQSAPALAIDTTNNVIRYSSIGDFRNGQYQEIAFINNADQLLAGNFNFV